MDAKYEQQFKKGALEMVLLSLIAKKRTYGYELIEHLDGNGLPLFQNIKEGTIYPILYRLEDDRLVISEISSGELGGRVKKYYEITERGNTVLSEMKQFWTVYKDCIDQLMEGNDE